MKNKDEMVLVWDSVENTFLQKSYKTMSSANRAVDKRNKNYGSYRYYIKNF